MMHIAAGCYNISSHGSFKNPNTEPLFALSNVKRFKVRLKLVGCSITVSLPLEHKLQLPQADTQIQSF